MNRRRRLAIALLLAFVVGVFTVTVVYIAAPGQVPYISGSNATIVLYAYVPTSYYGTHEITANVTTNVAVYEISRVFATPKAGGVDLSRDFNLDLEDVYITWSAASKSGVIVYKTQSWAFKAVLVETPGYYMLRPDFFRAGDAVACGAGASLPMAYAVVDVKAAGTTPDVYVVRTLNTVSCGSTVDLLYTAEDAAPAVLTATVPPATTFQGEMKQYGGTMRNQTVYFIQRMYVIAATSLVPTTLYVYYK
jgi:hypothetical protein